MYSRSRLDMIGSTLFRSGIRHELLLSLPLPSHHQQRRAYTGGVWRADTRGCTGATFTGFHARCCDRHHSGNRRARVNPDSRRNPIGW
jgi:hypothetical protein